jgi:hypothetical protein
MARAKPDPATEQTRQDQDKVPGRGTGSNSPMVSVNFRLMAGLSRLFPPARLKVAVPSTYQRWLKSMSNRRK